MKLVIWLLLPAIPCIAQIGPCYTDLGPCHSEATGVLQKIELTVHTAKLLAILADAIQQAKIAGFNGNNLGLELGEITRVLQAGQALNQATQNLPAQWAGTWTMPPTIPVTGVSTPGFHTEYSKWSMATQSSLQAAMLAGQLAYVHQSNAVGILNQIETLLNVLDSRNKAIQTTAAGTMRTAASLEKMHSTILSQGSAQMTYNQFQLQQQLATEAASYKFFTYAEPISDHVVAPTVPVIGP